MVGSDNASAAGSGARGQVQLVHFVLLDAPAGYRVRLERALQPLGGEILVLLLSGDDGGMRVMVDRGRDDRVRARRRTVYGHRDRGGSCGGGYDRSSRGGGCSRNDGRRCRRRRRRCHENDCNGQMKKINGLEYYE